MLLLKDTFMNRFRLIFLIVLFGLLGCETAVSTPTTQSATRRATATAEVSGLSTAVSPTETTSLAPAPTLAPTAAPVDSTPSSAGEPTPGPMATIPPTETAVPAAATVDPATFDEGALIAVSMNGTVGVLLDGIPLAIRDEAIERIMAQDDQYWLDMAHRQTKLTKYRLNFRNYKYGPSRSQLPMPPEELWQFALTDDEPRRVTVNDHDLLVRDYLFTSTLLSDAVSPGIADPALGEIGGIWREPFILPLDPDFLLQRTGLACVNEAGFPPNSYDSENVRTFYDYTCTPGSTGPLGCHRNEVPSLSCTQAVDGVIGRLDTSVDFERLPWDDALADEVRVGDVTHIGAPDLHVVESDLDINRIVYRYIDEGNCALLEGAVGGTGWRRLLLFTATLHNFGTEAMHIGPVTAEDPSTNIFTYDSCHDHFHFSNYGSFVFEAEQDANGSKRAFCVESTNRFSNNEFAPLTHEYSCTFQGIQAGWVDEYIAGLDMQWIDITDVEIEEGSTVATVGFLSNEDQFLCEGERVLNEAGEPLYEPTGERTQEGLPISRPQCNFVDNWDVNNQGFTEIEIPAVGGLVTAPCTAGEFGQWRNCGFSEYEPAQECTPGETVTVTMELEEPMVLRSCEVSDVLGIGLACEEDDAISNVIMGLNSTSTVQFTCPLVRDYERDEDDEDARLVKGGYALYVAPYFGELE